MKYEVILYGEDQKGEKKKISCYVIGAIQLAKEMKRLDEDKRNGVIADYEVAEV